MSKNTNKLPAVQEGDSDMSKGDSFICKDSNIKINSCKFLYQYAYVTF